MNTTPNPEAFEVFHAGRQAAPAQPLTDEQIAAGFDAWQAQCADQRNAADFIKGVRFAERARGTGAAAAP